MNVHNIMNNVYSITVKENTYALFLLFILHIFLTERVIGIVPSNHKYKCKQYTHTYYITECLSRNYKHTCKCLYNAIR